MSSARMDCRACRAHMLAMERQPLDPCITSLVLALNASGFRTVACCCGHGVRPGSVVLADGSELIVCRTWEEARMTDGLWPTLIDGGEG